MEAALAPGRPAQLERAPASHKSRRPSLQRPPTALQIQLEQRVAAQRRLAGRNAPAQRRRQRTAAAATAAAADLSAASSSSGSSSSSSSSTATAATLAGLRLTSPCGRFVVRPLDKGDAAEVRRLVALQTEAFHTPAKLSLVDGLSRKFFEAEVLSEMQKKLRFNPDDLFASLVIEPADPGSAAASGGGGKGGGSSIIGGVEVSYIGLADTLRLLEPGTEGYCYIASMVVAPAWRRRGAARALLAAAEAAAAAWDERQAVLQVYRDNEPAIELYQRQGYEVLPGGGKKGGGPLWGARPRYTMRKRW